MSKSAAALITHKNKILADQAVFLDGHAYVECQFLRCVLVSTGAKAFFQNCLFTDCSWRLELSVHDRRDWEFFLKNMAPVITDSLPVL